MPLGAIIRMFGGNTANRAGGAAANDVGANGVGANGTRVGDAAPVGGPSDVARARDVDGVEAKPPVQDVPMAKTLQQQAVSELRDVIKQGKLSEWLKVELKTGKLTRPEQGKLFAALPTLTAATTPKQLLELGLISKIPEGIEAMWQTTPRYFVGRQVLVAAPVETDHNNREKFHTYKEGGEVRVTHRAYIVGEQGNRFQVLVEGKDEPISVPKADLYRLNEGHKIEGTRGKAYGVDIDYEKDLVFKAKICAAIIQLDELIGKLDFRTQRPAVVEAALAKVPAPPLGTPVMAKAGTMVKVPSFTQTGIGGLSNDVAAPLKNLIEALGLPVAKRGALSFYAPQPLENVGPSVQRVLSRLVDKDGAPKDLGGEDWPKLAAELQEAIAKDDVLVQQRQALEVLHKQIWMAHPNDVRGTVFGNDYRPEHGKNGEAGKLANGGLGVCNLQASVLFALMQPLKQTLGFDTQLEMGACIIPRAGRDGQVNVSPPHGWVIVSMWPSGERFVSDRTWHHPAIALDYAFSVSGNRRHVTFDPNVAQNAVVTSKQIDMSGTFTGVKPMPVGDAKVHGRPDDR